MDKLKAILESNGVNKTDEELRQYIESFGLVPENIDDDDILKLSSLLISKSGKITQSKGGKATTKGKRSPATPNNLNAAIKKVAHQTSRELEELTDAIEQGADGYSRANAQKMLDTLADVPNKTVQYFADLAQDYEGDPEGFRQLGNEISNSLFGSYATVATE